MTRSRMSRLPLLATATALALALPQVAPALVVTVNNSPSELADTLFLNVPGLTLGTSSFTSGAFGQFGIYQNTTGTYGLPLTGIVLSTGNVRDYGNGPNDGIGTTTQYFTVATNDQNTILEPITGRETHRDVADVTFNFMADAATSMVTFFATFGSEEFPEFVNSSFNDGFGLFVNGTNVAGVRPTVGGPNLPVNIDHPDMAPIGGTELDGVLAPNGSPVLRFDVPVTAGAANQFRIILADTSDARLDTTIYLSSFFADGGTGGSGVGSSEFNPILPSNPPDPVTGAFVIELPSDLAENQVVWIDPPIAVGYTYALNGTGAFASIVAPSLATVADLNGYKITINGVMYDLAPGGTLDLAALGLAGVTGFTLTGIDEALALDPANTAAFPLGISLTGFSGALSVTQTPITVGGPAVIPLPATGLLLIAGLGGLAALRRRAARA